MEKMSRMKKYKDLREQINEEVTIDRTKPIVEEKIEEDDFLKEVKPRDYQNVVVDAINDGTLGGIAFEELLGKDEEEAVGKALTRAKAYGGRESDTRMDIYNRIRKQSSVASKEIEKEEIIKETQVQVEVESEKKTSLLEKLAALSPKEEVAEEVKEIIEKQEESVVEETLEKQEISENEEVVEEVNENSEEIVEEEIEEVQEKERTPLGVKILNGIIGLLVLVVICLFAYLIKMFI